MNSVFETRQRAAALLKETLSIWRQSDQSDYLEGLETDPIFTLLTMAVAYQGNEIDSEIEHLKEETLDEFTRLLTPYEIGHATPASIVIQSALKPDVSEMETGANLVFRLAAQHSFIPLLNTRVLNVNVGSVVRVDGRRWKVTLEFPHPIKNLSRFSFAITGLNFRDLTVTLGKQPLPIIKPWDYSELPFNECFSPLNIIFNRQQVCNFSMLPMELFARHNIRMYCIRENPLDSRTESLLESGHVELMFEFSGTTDNFSFDKSSLLLNAMVLVNAQVHETSLSAQKPFARIAGFSDNTDSTDTTDRQFLHLLQPAAIQIFGETELEVRRMNADRFNQGSLVKLLQCILNKYHSDFYAFQELTGMNSDKMIYNLQEALHALTNAAVENPLRNAPGVYLLLKNKNLVHNKDFSLSVKYLTTAGAALNSDLRNTAEIQSPSGFDNEATKIITPPIQGTDEITDNTGIHSLLHYYMLSGDRIVTPADIKVFCYKELLTRYGIEESMINRITISHRQTTDRKDCGYEILTEITLSNHTFITRTFAPILTSAEILLQKMLEVRSANIYPIRVNIHIEP